MAPFDPEAPLPGAPDPWAGSEMPARRDAPPYAMTEMIAAEPALAERLVLRLGSDPAVAGVAAAIRDAAASGAPIITTGCGTSEHAAMVAAALLTDALDGPIAWPMQALELARRPPAGAFVLAVSHEGGTWATNLALSESRAAGCFTALITVSGRSPGAALADLVLTTEEQDQSWCHTVGYLSPVIAGAVVAGVLRDAPLDPLVVRTLVGLGDDGPGTEAVAGRLKACARLLVVGSGVDYPAARELALKIEEGARMPASAMPLETLRHGHLAAADERTGLVVVLTDGEARGETVLERSRAVLRSASVLGMPSAAIVAADVGDDVPQALTTAGRLSVPGANSLKRIVGSAIGSAVPLQLLAERLARARGLNPDGIGRDDPRQAAAADA